MSKKLPAGIMFHPDVLRKKLHELEGALSEAQEEGRGKRFIGDLEWRIRAIEKALRWLGELPRTDPQDPQQLGLFP